MQIGSAQSKLLLLVVLGVVFRVVDGVVDEVPRRVVLEVVTLLGGAVHVAWTHASGSVDSETADFAVMSGFTNFNTTTARTRRPCPHEFSDTPHTVAEVIV